MLRPLGAGDPTPREEVLQRISNLKARMADAQIDFCVIMQSADLFYLTGSAQKGTLVLPVDGEPLFFVQRSIDRATAETPLPIIGIGTDKEIGQMVREAGIRGKGAMELDVLPVALFERFKGITGFADFDDISSIVRDLRIVKSPFEIEQIRKSGSICDWIFTKAREVIKEGARELDIDADLVAEGRKFGHQGLLRMRGFNQEMMSLYVAAGYAGTVPSNADVPVSGLGLTSALAQGSSVERVRRGIPLIVDTSGGHNGYITDETRSYVVGDLDELFVEPFEVSRAIVEETEVFAKEGIDSTEIFEKAIARVKRAHLQDHFMGFGKTQVTFIGHGLGLEINELPVITARHHFMLKEGTVFALEPKFIFPGKGVVGIEVDFIVRKNGLERVTKTPVDLVRL
jgi:Xaa-Pro dipeptidase